MLQHGVEADLCKPPHQLQVRQPGLKETLGLSKDSRRQGHLSLPKNR